MAYVRELCVEQPLVDAVKARGGIAYKFTSPGRRAVPDRMVILPGGVFFFVECKAPGQKPTAAQTREHNRLRDLGLSVFVLDNQFDIEPLLNNVQAGHMVLESKRCQEKDCNRPAKCKGLCTKHYQKKYNATEKSKAVRKAYYFKRKCLEAGIDPESI